MVSHSLRKLKEKHNKPKFPADLFELQKKKPKIAEQVMMTIEGQQNSIREFTKENFQVVLNIFRKYLLFVLHVTVATKYLKEFNSVMYFKHLVGALQHNYNYYGKRCLEQYIKLNFFMLCLIFSSIVEKSNGKVSEQAQKTFSSSIKYFSLYMSWERSKSDYIINAIISIVMQILIEHKKKLLDRFVVSVTKAINFYKNNIKSGKLPNESAIEVTLPRDNEQLNYFKKAIDNMCGSKNDFLDPNGTHLHVLKE